MSLRYLDRDFADPDRDLDLDRDRDLDLERDRDLDFERDLEPDRDRDLREPDLERMRFLAEILQKTYLYH